MKVIMKVGFEILVLQHLDLQMIQIGPIKIGLT